MDIHHPFLSEFPQHREIAGSAPERQQIREMFEEYHQLDDAVCRMRRKLSLPPTRRLTNEVQARKLKDALYSAVSRATVVGNKRQVLPALAGAAMVALMRFGGGFPFLRSSITFPPRARHFLVMAEILRMHARPPVSSGDCWNSDKGPSPEPALDHLETPSVSMPWIRPAGKINHPSLPMHRPECEFNVVDRLEQTRPRGGKCLLERKVTGDLKRDVLRTTGHLAVVKITFTPTTRNRRGCPQCRLVEPFSTDGTNTRSTFWPTSELVELRPVSLVSFDRIQTRQMSEPPVCFLWRYFESPWS